MITLQNFQLPEPGICTEETLYHRATGAVGLSYDTGQYLLGQGATLSFETYFNLFNLDSWRGCDLDGLSLEVVGHGTVEIQLLHAPRGRSPEAAERTVVTLDAATAHVLDLSTFWQDDATGTLSLKLTALDGSFTLHRARFVTRSLPSDRPLPQLTLSITTFKREDEVRTTVSRLEDFLSRFPFADHIRVQVVDNGHSAEIPNSAHVTSYDNPNYGGAGGFTRGLIEAENAGASHCLFMDDDASFHMENITRTFMMLALSRDPKTAVAGAMINARQKWAIWENTAWFDGVCRPLWHGLDLRDRDCMLQMQHENADPKPDTQYGGWWFFAFPIAEVKHYPFPFFVRGDDSSFSMANPFHIRTLNGVVSFQEGFSEKESPLVLYLDLRYHLIHHLTFDRLERSPLKTAWVGLRLMVRTLLRLHYASTEAQLLAMQDVMEGPAFFDRNLDMSDRRARLREIGAEEAWQPIATVPQGHRHRRFTRLPRKLRTALGLWSLNGHLLPFTRYFFSQITLQVDERRLVYYTLGANQVTFVNATRDQAYCLHHDKKRFAKIVWQMAKTTYAFCRDFEQLKTAYRQGYDARTRRSYWEKTLDLSNTQETQPTTSVPPSQERQG